MSSVDLRILVNKAREEFGEAVVRNNDFIARIEDEIDDLTVTKLSQPLGGGTPQKYYDLTIEQCTLVGMRESKGVRREVLAELKRMEAKLNHKQPALPNFADPAAAARAWADAVDNFHTPICDKLLYMLHVTPWRP